MDFATNDPRTKRALDSLLMSAQSIKGDAAMAADIIARGRTLRHFVKEAGHHV